jgi:cation:H+ antiporter
MNYILLVLGLVILIKGADYLIEGAGSLAKRLKIPTLIVGLTVVALGTSLPELMVSIISAKSGLSDIAIGNVIGSNIANILLIMGLTSLLVPLKIAHSTVWKEIPISLGAIIMLFLLSNFNLLGHNINVWPTMLGGILLLAFFLYYIFYLFKSIKSNKTDLSVSSGGIDVFSFSRTAIFIIIGTIGLLIGGKLTVIGATSIAKIFGMSDFLISATIIAIGTSAPELITSIRAAMRKNPDLAVGNIIGSNIINILLVLGLTSTIWGITIPAGLNFDMLFLIAISILLFIFLFIGKKHELKRWQGLVFILAYLGYLTFVIIRG